MAETGVRVSSRFNKAMLIFPLNLNILANKLLSVTQLFPSANKTTSSLPKFFLNNRSIASELTSVCRIILSLHYYLKRFAKGAILQWQRSYMTRIGVPQRPGSVFNVSDTPQGSLDLFLACCDQRSAGLTPGGIKAARGSPWAPPSPRQSQPSPPSWLGNTWTN